jgi:hypothetical protein
LRRLTHPPAQLMRRTARSGSGLFADSACTAMSGAGPGAATTFVGELSAEHPSTGVTAAAAVAVGGREVGVVGGGVAEPASPHAARRKNAAHAVVNLIARGPCTHSVFHERWLDNPRLSRAPTSGVRHLAFRSRYAFASRYSEHDVSDTRCVGGCWHWVSCCVQQ